MLVRGGLRIRKHNGRHHIALARWHCIQARHAGPECTNSAMLMSVSFLLGSSSFFGCLRYGSDVTPMLVGDCVLRVVVVVLVMVNAPLKFYVISSRSIFT